MKYAVIASGGKQYRVSEGDIIDIESTNKKDGETVSFEQVLLYCDGGDVSLGKPVLNNVIVAGKVLIEKKGKKIRVSKFKAKARYRRVIGHRQHLTSVQIAQISKKAQKKA